MVANLAHDEVRLTVPATAEYARVARIATSGIAARLGFSIDDVEQLKLAVGEVWSTIAGDHGSGRMTVTFAIGTGSLRIDIDTHGAEPASASDVALAEKVLEEIVDSYELSRDGRHASFAKSRAS
jgi:serine/threonine-protein kinase RsbW